MAGLRIFRRADAPDLADTELMAAPEMDPMPPMDVLAELGAREGGYVNKVLFGDPTGGGMSLVWLWYAAHYTLPRHSHDVDCTYYVVAGEAHMGNQVVPAGDGFFVPAGAPYAYSAGPDGVEVLEFRAASRFGIRITETRWPHLLDLARQHGDAWEAATPAHR
jgi:quercetin dioxygenase-like cupin family protein